jgi:hypothetical protein
MKKLIFKFIIFIVPVVIVVYAQHLYLLNSDSYKTRVEGSEIYRSIYKSKQKGKSRKLLIGDSVAEQMFSNIKNTDTVNSLACNQAIGIVGHYLLLNNYLNAGNQIDTLYMLFTPFSFDNNLNQIFTYHYFLKPFYKQEYMPLFTKTVYRQVHKIPYYFMCQNPVVLTSDWAPNFNSKDVIHYSFMSPVSAEYLSKIKELSIKYNFKILLLPTPTRLSKKPYVEGIDKNELTETGFISEFKDYFDKFIYLNDTNFVDKFHLKYKNSYTDYYKKVLMKW